MIAESSILRQIPKRSLPVSIQLMARASDHPAAHVLDYLAKCEHAAALRNRRDMVVHYQECWRLVFEQLNGLLPLPIMAVTPRPLCPEPVVARLKGWERDKYSKPSRRVVDMYEAASQSAIARYGIGAVVLILECKHEVDAGPLYDPNKPPKRRRCAQCQSASYAQRVELQRFRGTRQ